MSGPQSDKLEPAEMTAGIAVDNWKLPTFRKHLPKEGYEIESEAKMSPAVTIIKVKCSDQFALQRVVEKCQRICARKRLH